MLFRSYIRSENNDAIKLNPQRAEYEFYVYSPVSEIANVKPNTNKKLLKVTDLLGRETKATNQLLFYIYDDGTVEKKIVIE